MAAMLDRRAFTSMLAASVAGLCGSAAAGTTSRLDDGFRDEVIAVGRRHFPEMPFAPGRGTVLSGDHTLYLQSIHAAVEGLSPADREAAIVRWLAHFTPAADIEADAVKTRTDSWGEAKPLLRPRLMNQATTKISPQIIGETFSPDLRLVFTIDLGDKDLYVSDEKFARWKVPQSAVRAAAIDNLECLSRTMRIRTVTAKGVPGRYAMIDSGDGYDAARLVLPAFRDRLMAALGPDIVAAVPGRDLMVCWSRDFGNQEAMVHAVEELEERMPHSLTQEMFRVTKDRLVPMRAGWTK